MRDITSWRELNHMKKEKFEEFLVELFSDKEEAEKEAFKTFLNTPIVFVDNHGYEKNRMPGYYEIQSYIARRYYPHIVHTKEKTTREKLLELF